MKPSEILIEARQVLEKRGWCKGHHEDREGRVCAQGALNKVWTIEKTPVRQTAYDYLLKVAEGEFSYSITAYNDRMCKTIDDVFVWFDNAISLAQQHESCVE